MGVDNRDWYRAWWAKKQGYVERSDFRGPVPKPPKKFHWSLVVVALLLVFVLATAVVKFVR